MARKVYLLIVEVTMHIKRFISYWFILILIMITFLFYWFGANKPPPEQNFSTSQLLISSLPGWSIYSEPEDWAGDRFYLARVVGGSVIRFMKVPEGVEQWSPSGVNNGLWEQIADMTQWVVKFYTIGDAKQAYKEHYWVPGDTQNPFKTSPWQPLDEFEYKSQLADQFRIVCESDRQLVTGCFLEAQYDEFYVLVNYSSVNAYNNDKLLSDLNSIAIAVDAQMEKYLGIQR